MTRKEQTIRQTDGSKTETTLSSVDTRGSWPTMYNSSTETLKSGGNWSKKYLSPNFPTWE